jgi:membrane associated rhomboid family serine protease
MLFPIKDYNPTRKISYITIIFIIINVVVFFYQAYISELTINIFKNAMIPWEITHMKNLDEPVRVQNDNLSGFSNRNLVYRDMSPFITLVTSMFMHGSILHIFGNMLFLWIFGNNIEDYLGKIKFIIFYILSGLGASFVHILFHPHSTTPVIGASGAVSGVMGAYLILFPSARIRTLVFVFFFITFVDIPAFVFLIIWFIFQFLYVGGEGIAWIAHIGGFIIGLLTVKLWGKKKPVIELIE